mmetsp:Transcript_47861/g.128178  ORF Transcript_47861/g.128178 Transcript_47861/m.128178 type:complete len:414 (+) Transcript_47861:1258-2499(+)
MLADAPGDGAHVAGRNLVPGVGEGVVEGGLILGPSFNQLLVLRVDRQGHVTGEHAKLLLFGAGILDAPLPVVGGALVLFPFEVLELLEVDVVPLQRLRGPLELEAAGEGVLALARAAFARPRVRGILHRRRARARGASAVRLAEGVAASDERNGLAVVHCHAAEGVADVLGAARGVRLAQRTLRVEVDEADGRGAQRRLAGAVDSAGIERLLDGGRAQCHGVGVADGIHAAGAEAEDRAAHGLDGGGAGEDDEVAPGEAKAVLHLDRHEQRTSLVQVRVVCPTPLRVEALVAALGASPTVGDAVRARGVPGQAQEEGRVVAEVSRPMLLGLREQFIEVLLHGVDIEFRHGLRETRLRNAPAADLHGVPPGQRTLAAEGAARRNKSGHHEQFEQACHPPAPRRSQAATRWVVGD